MKSFRPLSKNDHWLYLWPFDLFKKLSVSKDQRCTFANFVIALCSAPI